MAWVFGGLGRWLVEQRPGQAEIVRSIDRLPLEIPSSVQGDPCSCLCLGTDVARD